MNTEKITKLLTRADALNERITNMQQERDELLEEAKALIDGTTPAAKTTRTRNAGTQSLGATILEWLSDNPGSDLAAIGRGLKISTQKIGVSLFHLKNNDQVRKEGDLYYPKVAMTAAAKTVQPYVTPDD